MQRHHSKLPSASSHALGVVGRLMRAFPARAVVDAGDVVDAMQHPVAPAEKAAPAAVGPQLVTPRNQGLLGRLETWIWRQQQREREAYLAEATDIADLEARMRVLELRQLRHHRPF